MIFHSFLYVYQFTRGYLQGRDDFVPSVSPSSRHPGPPYPSGGGKRHFRPPRPWTTWYHWNIPQQWCFIFTFTNVIQWRVANIGFTSQELLNCNSSLYVYIYLYICMYICMYISNGSRVATTNREVGWSSRQSKAAIPLRDGANTFWPTGGYGNSWSIKWVRLVGGILWYTYPSEKWWSSSVDDDIPNIWENNPNVPNHQPEEGFAYKIMRI